MSWQHGYQKPPNFFCSCTEAVTLSPAFADLNETFSSTMFVHFDSSISHQPCQRYTWSISSKPTITNNPIVSINTQRNHASIPTPKQLHHPTQLRPPRVEHDFNLSQRHQTRFRDRYSHRLRNRRLAPGNCGRRHRIPPASSTPAVLIQRGDTGTGQTFKDDTQLQVGSSAEKALVHECELIDQSVQRSQFKVSLMESCVAGYWAVRSRAVGVQYWYLVEDCRGCFVHTVYSSATIKIPSSLNSPSISY